MPGIAVHGTKQTPQEREQHARSQQHRVRLATTVRERIPDEGIEEAPQGGAGIAGLGVHRRAGTAAEAGRLSAQQPSATPCPPLIELLEDAKHSRLHDCDSITQASRLVAISRQWLMQHSDGCYFGDAQPQVIILGTVKARVE